MNEDIKRYLEENFLFEFDDEVDARTDLIKAGVIDSYGYVLLLRYLEKEHGLCFGDEEMLDRISFSLDGIATLVASRGRGTGGQACAG